MRKQGVLQHEFVKYIPEKLDETTIYISIPYATAVHKCCCGCGNEVVTPFSPTDWKLIYNGESVSLYPSIGSWALPCKSHYWIRDNRVEWAPQWSQQRIDAGRIREAAEKKEYFAVIYSRADKTTNVPSSLAPAHYGNFMQRLFKWLFH